MNWPRYPYPRQQLDDFGQVDGDAGGAVQFQGAGGGTPWLREGVPPWHMWGNTMAIGPIDATSSDEATVFTPGQLIKVSYKRPETWHWVFGAKILNVSAESPGVGATARLTVHFDLIVGVGRSQIVMPDFDVFSWVWEGLIQPPFAHLMWATSAKTPPLNYIFTGSVWEPDPATIRTIDQIEGQDIQLACRVDFFQSGWNDTRPNATVEVSAFLAPKVHVRPDWHVKGPPEVMFPGAETQGR